MSNTTSTAAEPIPDNTASLLDAWIYLQLVPNIVLLPLLIATFIFATSVKRHPTLINVCVTWVLSGFFNLLLYFGNQHKIPATEVSPGLCIVQASLLYGIPPMWSLGVLMMVFHLLNTLRLSGTPQTNRSTMLIMLVSPYLVECLFTIAALGIALHDPEKVTRSRAQFYCSVASRELSLFRIILTLLLCIAILAMEVRLAWIVYSRYRATRSAGLTLNVGLGLFVRVLLFGFFVFLGMIANMIPLVHSQSHLPDIYVALMGLVIFLIFGTQNDVVDAWKFWNWRWRKLGTKSSRKAQPINIDLANVRIDDDKDSVDEKEWTTIPIEPKKTPTPAIERGEARRPWSTRPDQEVFVLPTLPRT